MRSSAARQRWQATVHENIIVQLNAARALSPSALVYLTIPVGLVRIRCQERNFQRK